MYKQEVRAAEAFIEKSEFGVLLREVVKYISEQFNIENISSQNPETAQLYVALVRLCRKHAKSLIWKNYARALLQFRGGAGSLFLSAKGAGDYERNVLSPHITNKTQLTAKSQIAALARIFFEIENVFERMLKEQDVSKGCGYRILKFLYSSDRPLTTKEIMAEFDYSRLSKHEKYEDSMINPLKQIGLILKQDEKFQLSSKARDAFNLMKEKREEMRKFKYRIKWFYPFEK